MVRADTARIGYADARLAIDRARGEDVQAGAVQLRQQDQAGAGRI
jgi:hypothetical protein